MQSTLEDICHSEVDPREGAQIGNFILGYLIWFFKLICEKFTGGEWEAVKSIRTSTTDKCIKTHKHKINT